MSVACNQISVRLTGSPNCPSGHSSGQLDCSKICASSYLSAKTSLKYRVGNGWVMGEPSNPRFVESLSMSKFCPMFVHVHGLSIVCPLFENHLFSSENRVLVQYLSQIRPISDHPEANSCPFFIFVLVLSPESIIWPIQVQLLPSKSSWIPAVVQFWSFTTRKIWQNYKGQFLDTFR